MKTQIAIVPGAANTPTKDFEALVNAKLEELSKKFWIISIDVDMINKDAVIMYAEHGQKDKQPAKKESKRKN